MCAGRSCAACNVDDLDFPCTHNIEERHHGSSPSIVRSPSNEQIDGRVPTKPLPKPLLADRIEVNPGDPDSLAHFLETWAQIVRSKRCFSIIVEPARCED